MTLGERILILRRRRQLSQRGLAKVADVSFQTIAKLEQGGLHDLTGEYIVKLARALGVTADVLLGMVELDAEQTPSRSVSEPRDAYDTRNRDESRCGAAVAMPHAQPRPTARRRMGKATSVG
jgi:transcriptional regulator with XRE-family HTH domain